MNITQVRYAMAVSEFRNFSRAAEHLYITQPALSLQIAGLEKELGFLLFRRTPKGVELTEEGEVFVRKAQPVLAAWGHLVRSMELCRSSPAGSLRIGLGARVYSNRLFEPIVKFFDEHPEISVTFVTEISGSILEELKSGRLDVALDRLPPEKLIPERQLYYAEDLIRERQCVLMSPSAPESSRREIPFQELNGCAVATGPENSMEDLTIRQDCGDYGVTIGRTYRCDSVSALMSLIRAGRGVALGPPSFRDYYRLAAVPMLPEVYVSLCFICLRENVGDPKLTLLRRFLEELCLTGEKKTGNSGEGDML